MKRAKFILEEGNRMQSLNKNVIKDVQMNDAQNATSIITVMPIIPAVPKTVPEVPDFKNIEKKKRFLEEQAVKRRLEQEQSERDARMKEEIEKLNQLKNQMLESAQTQANQLIEEAQQASEVLKEVAYQESYAKGEREGYETGFTRGMNQAQEEGQSILTLAQSNAEAFFQMSQQYIADKKEEWIGNSIQMAQALIQKQFEMDETTILSVLEPIWLEIEKPDQLLIIRTHPQHFSILNEKMASRKTEIPNFRYVILKENSYTLYQVEVESDEMLLTFDLEEELQHFLEQLKKDESNEL